ncbi:MAG: hypothetical protein ACKOWF_10255 [Chloroflexota bacterium]
MTSLIRTGLRRGAAAAAIILVLAPAAAPLPRAAAHAAHGHPARIHNGSCEDLKGVAFELNGVGGEVDVAGNPAPASEAVNPDTAYQVMMSRTAIDASIDDLLTEPRALMVYQSDEDLTAIACGNLGGLRMEGELAVGLAEINVPGHTGLAVFEEDAPAPGKTTVTVYVGHALSPVSMGGSMKDGDGHGHDAEDAGHGDESGGHGDGDGDHAAATPSA